MQLAMVNQQQTLGRRRFIASGVAAVGTVAATSGVAHALVPSVPPSMPPGPTGPDGPVEDDAPTDVVPPVDPRYDPEDPDQHVDSLLGLSAGTQVGPFVVERVTIREGAARIEATGRGAHFRVDILRRSHSPRALADTDDFSLYLCNHGSGNDQTHEECGIGVLTLARYLQAARPEVPAFMLSYDQRRSAHPTRHRESSRRS
jgi:hypothetical protein